MPDPSAEPLNDSRDEGRPRGRMWLMSGVPYFLPFCRSEPHVERVHAPHPRGWTCDCPCHGGENVHWWSDFPKRGR